MWDVWRRVGENPPTTAVVSAGRCRAEGAAETRAARAPGASRITADMRGGLGENAAREGAAQGARSEYMIAGWHWLSLAAVVALTWKLEQCRRNAAAALAVSEEPRKRVRRGMRWQSRRSTMIANGVLALSVLALKNRLHSVQGSGQPKVGEGPDVAAASAWGRARAAAPVRPLAAGAGQSSDIPAAVYPGILIGMMCSSQNTTGVKVSGMPSASTAGATANVAAATTALSRIRNQQWRGPSCETAPPESTAAQALTGNLRP